jgi:hypothetical protein
MLAVLLLLETGILSTENNFLGFIPFVNLALMPFYACIERFF